MRAPFLRPAHRRTAAILCLLLAACGPADERGAEVAVREPVRAPAPAAADLAPPAADPADTVLLAGALERARELPRLRGMLVAQGGDVILEHFTDGAGMDRATNVKSASKSVLSALVGIAIAEGHIRGMEQPIHEFFPEYFARSGVEPAKRAITVGHLLSMQSGLESTSFGGYGAWVNSRDWVRAVLDRPMVDAPGGRMLYSTGSSHLLSAILTRATGMSTHAYANAKLGDALGGRIRPWQRDPQGIFFGGNDMFLSPRQLLRFGQLWMDGGSMDGRQVVPRAWVEASVVPRTSSPWNGHEYGLGWWSRDSGGRRAWFAWGYGGQFVFVVPEVEMVAVFTSQADLPRGGDHLRALHALVDDYLVPGAAARWAARGGSGEGQAPRIGPG